MRAVLALILRKIMNYTQTESPFVHKFYSIVSDGVFYGVFLSIGLECFLEFAIMTKLNLEIPIFTTNGE